MPSKLAEILEKVLKAELIRLGWPLERTHDLNRLVDELEARKSNLLVTVTPLAKRWRRYALRIAIRASISMIRTGRHCV